MQTTVEQVVASLPEINPERDRHALNRLDHKTGELMDAHMRATKRWVPDALIPYSIAEDYDEDRPAPPVLAIPRAVGSALFINTLTEDNLPGYFNEIAGHADMLSSNHALRDWAKRWTYEESRHGRVMDGYLAATRLVDADKLETARETLMVRGSVPHAQTGLQLLAYTTIQEKATQVAHNNTATCLREVNDGGGNDHNGAKIMAVVAGDEGRHYRFYGGLFKEALRVDPIMALSALARELLLFKMPGKHIPDFDRHSAIISLAGIYGKTQFLNQVLRPTFKLLEFDKIDVDRLPPDGQHAHGVITRAIDKIGTEVARRNRTA